MVIALIKTGKIKVVSKVSIEQILESALKSGDDATKIFSEIFDEAKRLGELKFTISMTEEDFDQLDLGIRISELPEMAYKLTISSSNNPSKGYAKINLMAQMLDEHNPMINIGLNINLKDGEFFKESIIANLKAGKMLEYFKKMATKEIYKKNAAEKDKKDAESGKQEQEFKNPLFRILEEREEMETAIIEAKNTVDAMSAEQIMDTIWKVGQNKAVTMQKFSAALKIQKGVELTIKIKP